MPELSSAMATTRVYLVASPIGDHLSDLSVAATRTLRKVRHLFVEAEDAYLERLRQHGIIGPEHILHLLDQPHLEQVKELLAAHESFALLPSSGIPCFVDPGREIVDLCLGEYLDEVELVPVGMSSALDAALSACGADVTFFRFNGHYPEQFLAPEQDGAMVPLVYFVRGHALTSFVDEIVGKLSPVRRVVVLKDMRKKGRSRIFVLTAEGGQEAPEVAPDADLVCVIDRRTQR